MTCKVFLSYASEDKASVDRVRREIETQSEEIEFVDFAVPSPPGTDWREPVRKLILDCDVVACVIGPETYQSAPVQWEIDLATKLGKPVVGFRLGDLGLVPPELNRVFASDRMWRPHDVRAALEMVTA